MEAIEAIDPPTANEPGNSFVNVANNVDIYTNNEALDALIKNDFVKYIEIINNKRLENYPKKEEIKEEPKEEPKIDNSPFKKAMIENIFDSIKNLEYTINRFQSIKKK
jgi:hypothetical protein